MLLGIEKQKRCSMFSPRFHNFSNLRFMIMLRVLGIGSSEQVSSVNKFLLFLSSFHHFSSIAFWIIAILTRVSWNHKVIYFPFPWYLRMLNSSHKWKYNKLHFKTHALWSVNCILPILWENHKPRLRVAWASA